MLTINTYLVAYIHVYKQSRMNYSIHTVFVDIVSVSQIWCLTWMLHITYYTTSSEVTIVFGHDINVTYYRQHIMAHAYCDVIRLLYDVLCFPRDSIVVARGNCLWRHETIVQLSRTNPSNAAKHQIFGIVKKFQHVVS